MFDFFIYPIVLIVIYYVFSYLMCLVRILSEDITQLLIDFGERLFRVNRLWPSNDTKLFYMDLIIAFSVWSIFTFAFFKCLYLILGGGVLTISSLFFLWGCYYGYNNNREIVKRKRKFMKSDVLNDGGYEWKSNKGSYRRRRQEWNEAYFGKE